MSDIDDMMDEASGATETQRVAASELRQFVEQWEKREVEKKDIAEQQKEIMAEAKARGYDTKIMREIIKLRAKDKGTVEEEEATLQMYKDALGM